MQEQFPLLSRIHDPDDLRKLPIDQLPQLATEVRQYLIDTITKVGGHFGSGLGVVELTIALHYVFQTPKDKLVWDTGHQGYPHKILTGRKHLLPTIRKKGGISGFLKRSESIYDVFGAGHASTSISAALGIATARDLMKKDFHVVAIIGDGAMTGGLAYEAMNNCGLQQRKLLVVLNDNQMSIAPNVWALANYFTELDTTRIVFKLRQNIQRLSEQLEPFGDRILKLLQRIEGGVKSIITPGMLFEALGFKYYGPINGHHLPRLIKILRFIRDTYDRPVLLHVTTQKGKGYEAAEKHPEALHAIGKSAPPSQDKIEIGSSHRKGKKYQDVFAEALIELMRHNEKIVAITAAMPSGTGLDKVAAHFPDRVFDVGIAEAHAVTYAAGLATEGMIPVCAIYSSFLQRAFDQIIHDCALQNLHVVFAMDRAGVVGADGPTHHGVFDLAALRVIPNMVLMAPKDERELRNMLYTAIVEHRGGPIALRYPRGQGPGSSWDPGDFESIPIGRAEILRTGGDVALLAIGKPVTEALAAASILEQHDVSAAVINARFAKPLDTALLDQLFDTYPLIVTIEDGQKIGGFGSGVLEYFHAYPRSTAPHIVVHGIEDRFVSHGTQEELYEELQLNAAGIARLVLESLHLGTQIPSSSSLDS